MAADRADALVGANYSINAEAFDLVSADDAGIERARSTASRLRAEALEQADEVLAQLGRRLTLGLSFLRAPLMSAKLEDASTWQAESKRLAETVELLSTTRDDCEHLERQLTQLAAL